MAHFLIEYREVGSPEARDKHRGEHIAYRKGMGEAIRLAGPILDDGGTIIGSLIILDAGDRAAAERLAEADPYVATGVLQLSSVRGFRIAAMKPPQT
jgi:uncharacterized protein YciI